MVTYKSQGGRRATPAEANLGTLRSLLIFLVIMGSLFGLTYYAQDKAWFNPDKKKTTAVQQSCRPVIPNSVFSTGDPLMDQRILWVILNDKTKEKTVAGNVVRHIWENADFKFTGEPERKLWTEATTRVTSVRSIEKPSLSITQDGTIIPFNPPSEIQSLLWTEVSSGNMPAQKSTFFTSSTLNENNKTPTVPTVLLSINGGTIVPAPTLGMGSQQVILETKPVCK